jgi:hypothetical protein
MSRNAGDDAKSAENCRLGWSAKPAIRAMKEKDVRRRASAQVCDDGFVCRLFALTHFHPRGDVCRSDFAPRDTCAAGGGIHASCCFFKMSWATNT